MIPRICANCEWGELLLGDVEKPMPADCHALPVAVRIDDARVHAPCSLFEMCAQPRVTVDDPAPVAQEGGAGDEPAEDAGVE